MFVNNRHIFVTLFALSGVFQSCSSSLDVDDNQLPYASYTDSTPCTSENMCEYLGLFKEIPALGGEALALVARGPDASCILMIANQADANWYGNYWHLAFEDGELLSAQVTMTKPNEKDKLRMDGLCEGALVKLYSSELNSAIIVSDDRKTK